MNSCRSLRKLSGRAEGRCAPLNHLRSTEWRRADTPPSCCVLLERCILAHGKSGISSVSLHVLNQAGSCRMARNRYAAVSCWTFAQLHTSLQCIFGWFRLLFDFLGRHDLMLLSFSDPTSLHGCFLSWYVLPGPDVCLNAKRTHTRVYACTCALAYVQWWSAHAAWLHLCFSETCGEA